MTPEAPIGLSKKDSTKLGEFYGGQHQEDNSLIILKRGKSNSLSPNVFTPRLFRKPLSD